MKKSQIDEYGIKSEHRDKKSNYHSNYWHNKLPICELQKSLETEINQVFLFRSLCSCKELKSVSVTSLAWNFKKKILMKASFQSKTHSSNKTPKKSFYKTLIIQ